MSLEKLEEQIIKMDEKLFINYCFDKNILKKSNECEFCKVAMKFIEDLTYSDGYSWRCINYLCTKYENRVSVRKFSFFNNFNISIRKILKIFIRYTSDQQRFSILKTLDVNTKTLRKIIKQLIVLFKSDLERMDMFGGPSSIVQIDETMLNYKCKSHRGRSPGNKTDALCIIEYKDSITKAFATIIRDKKAETMIPIICSKVVPGSLIYTDEHASYKKLTSHNFLHKSVCHKYEFKNKKTGAHTQGVESFNNSLKLEIKKRKGIKTNAREEFLIEFCWFFNNRKCRFDRLLELIKVP